MTRPLQKKKNKSSLPRVRQKPKSKKLNIKSNPIVAANWNPHQTLTQNYHRLGLTSKLNAHTGGTEYKVSKTKMNAEVGRGLAIPSSKAAKTVGGEEVKVVRDPETGAIIAVEGLEQGRNGKEGMKGLDDPLNEFDSSSGEDDGYGDTVGRNDRVGSHGIVPELEESTKYERKKRPKQQSAREKEWCARLVERWGEDWGGMFWDRRLNPMQQSEGDVRRRVRVYLAERQRQEGKATLG